MRAAVFGLTLTRWFKPVMQPVLAGVAALAGATLALHLREEAGMLTFDVVDDGKGFDAQAHGLGAGFLNMADRLGALGGQPAGGIRPAAGHHSVGGDPGGRGRWRTMRGYRLLPGLTAVRPAGGPQPGCAVGIAIQAPGAAAGRLG